MNINREDLFIINILNNIYNDNLRQIQSLQNSNNEIRRTISDLLYRNSRSTNYNRNRNNRTQYNNTSLNPYSNTIVTPASELNIFSQLLNTTSNLQNTFNNGMNNNQSLTNIFDTFFEPITIFPTQTEIENATRNVQFSDIVCPINTSCPILLEPFQDSEIVTVIRQCGHIFNRNELVRWFRTNCRCPVCRYDIREYRNNNSNNTNNSSNNNISNNNINDSSNNNLVSELDETQDGSTLLNNDETSDLESITRRIMTQFLTRNNLSNVLDSSRNETSTNSNSQPYREREYSMFFTFPYTRTP